MSKSQDFKLNEAMLFVPLAILLAIWGMYWLELKLGVNLNTYGIYPRTLKGLRGVLLSPFIHGSLNHLYNNSLPLLILLSVLFYFFRTVGWRVLCYGYLLSGLLLGL